MSDQPPAGEVAVFGSLNLDAVWQVARAPMVGETVFAELVRQVGGGKGANQAVAAARGGAKVEMIGCVGTDEAGATLLARLGADAVGSGQVRRVADVATGAALVVVDAEGENRVIVDRGANARLGAADARRAKDILARADVLLLQAEALWDGCVAAAEHAQGLVVLNLAPASEPPGPLLAAIDILVVNEGELRTLRPGSRADLGEASVEASVELGRPVIVTLGAAGALLARGTDLTRFAAPPVRALDTTGAGDCFCGSLAAELARGEELAKAARLATERASASVAEGREPNASR